MTAVFIKKIENFDAREKANIMETLSESARSRLSKKRNEKEGLAFINTISLLTEEQRTDLEYSENGRPFFKTLDGCISISHSKNYCTVAISDNKSSPVGIDIEEHLLSNEKQQQLADRFFTEKEKKAHQEGAAFYEIWTKKEALFKALDDQGIPFTALDTESNTSMMAKTMSNNDFTLTVFIVQGTSINIKKIM